MSVSESTLMSALGDAAEGRRVLVLTKQAIDNDAIAQRAKELAIENLCRYAKATLEQAKQFVTAGENPWQICMKSGGWVFFYPEPELGSNDDVGNPSFVYVPRQNGRHEKMSYMKWRSMMAPPKPIDFTTGEATRTAWDHLLEDDE